MSPTPTLAQLRAAVSADQNLVWGLEDQYTAATAKANSDAAAAQKAKLYASVGVQQDAQKLIAKAASDYQAAAKQAQSSFDAAAALNGQLTAAQQQLAQDQNAEAQAASAAAGGSTDVVA